MATFAEPDATRPELHEFQAAFEVVFVDGSGFVNLTADLSATTLHVVCSKTFKTKTMSHLIFSLRETIFLTSGFGIVLCKLRFPFLTLLGC